MNSYRSSTLLLAIIASFCFMHDPPHGVPQSKERQGSAQAAEREHLACYKGTVKLGETGRAIDFQVRCNPVRAGERVGIGVSLSGAGKMQIEAFRRHPTLLEELRGVPRRGSCRRDRHRPPNLLICEARVSHSALIQGRFWISQGNGCDSDVALTSSPKIEPCQGSCATDYRVVILANGPPRGC